jgi:hypothetical protein
MSYFGWDGSSNYPYRNTMNFVIEYLMKYLGLESYEQASGLLKT